MLINTLKGLTSNNVVIFNTIVRWKRKPRWLPVAKSKVFRVPERKKAPVEEAEELLKLHNNYRTQIKLLRSYLHQEAVKLKKTSTADHLIITPQDEEDDFIRSLEKNNAWNAEISIEKSRRIKEETEQYKKQALENMAYKKQKEETRKKELELVIRSEKEKLASLIDKNNLKEAIEFALANPVDYNFAIDTDGKMYKEGVINKNEN